MQYLTWMWRIRNKIFLLIFLCSCIVPNITVIAQDTAVIPFPLFINGRFIDNIDVRIESLILHLHAEQLMILLEDELVPDRLERISRLGNKWFSIDDLQRLGVDVNVDQEMLQVGIHINVSDIPVKEISISSPKQRTGSSRLQPAAFNAVLNISSSVAVNNWETFLNGDSGVLAYSVKPQFVAQLNGWVLDTCHTISNTSEGVYELNSVRVSHDWVEQSLRLEIGDIHYSTLTFQNSYLSKGFAVSYKPRLIHPPGFTYRVNSFGYILEIPEVSSVKIAVNETSVYKDTHFPGNYLFNDFRLSQGINKVQYTIRNEEDALKEQAFYVAHDNSLLNRAETEFTYGIGMPKWEVSWPGIFGNQRYGVMDNLTAEYMFQLTEDQQNAGAGVIWATPSGTYKVHNAVSYSADRGLGTTVRVRYEHRNMLSGNKIRYGLSAEYTSELYTPFGVMGISNPNELHLTGTVSAALVDGVSFSNSLNLTVPLEPDQMTIKNKAALYIRPSLPFDLQLDGYVEYGPSGFDWGAKLVFKYRHDASASVMVNNEISTGRMNAFLNYIPGMNSARSNVSVGLENFSITDPVPEAVNIQGNMHTQYFCTYLHHGMKTSQPDISHNSSLNVSFALVYADGLFGLSSPISDGFVIVQIPEVGYMNPLVEQAPADNSDLQASIFGTAVKVNTYSYQNSRIDLDAFAIPFGYEVDTSVFDFYSGYRQAAVLRLESQVSLVAKGRMMYSDSTPVSYVLGKALEKDKPEAEPILFFTDTEGKFFIYNLKQTDYSLILNIDREMDMQLEITDKQTGEINMGDIFLPFLESSLDNTIMTTSTFISPETSDGEE